MSGILDKLLFFLPEGYRRDARFAVLIALICWFAFSFNARLADAETKANRTDAIQAAVYTLQQQQAITGQKVSDIDENVSRLVSAALGPQAVVQHPTPPPPPTIKPLPH